MCVRMPEKHPDDTLSLHGFYKVFTRVPSLIRDENDIDLMIHAFPPPVYPEPLIRMATNILFNER